MENKVFKEDIFKYDNTMEFNPEEVNYVARQNTKRDKNKALKEIQEQKDIEFIETMEKDDDVTDKYIADTEQAKLKKTHEQREEMANALDMLTGKSSYRVNIAEYGMYVLMHSGFSSRYEYHCVPTKKGQINVYGKSIDVEDGLLFVLKDTKTGKVYTSGMLCSYDAQIDLYGIHVMATNVENRVDSLDGTLVSSKPKEDTPTILKPDGTAY